MKRYFQLPLVLLLVVQSFFSSAQDDCLLSLDSGFPIITSPRCSDPNGAIEVSATGTGLVEYSINGGPFVTSGLFDDLSTAIYTITMRDENCDISLVVDLEGEESIELQSINTTPSECDQDTGTITINATGLGLRYSIDGGAFQQSNVFNNLPGGVYTVQIQDANDCIEIREVVVNQGSIDLQEIIVRDTDCERENGRIEVIATGDGLQYRLAGVTDWQNSPVFGGLPPGSYNLRIMDNEGCLLRQRVIISNTLEASLTPVNPMCGEDNGEIIVNVDPISDYQFSIDGGATYQNSNIFRNLPIGPYTIRIRLRGSNCFITRSVRLDIDPEITIENIQRVRPTCNASNGSINITANGNNLRYFLTSDTISRNNRTGIFPNLPEGTYMLVIRNDEGCELPRNINLVEVNDINIRGIATTPSSCSIPEGSITIDAVSRLGEDITYSIDGGPFTSNNVFGPLVAQMYTITVASTLGCTVEQTVVVPALPPIVVLEIPTSVPSSSCTSDGEISVIVQNPVGVEYSLDNINFQPENVFTGLAAGIYVIYIRDDRMCSTRTGEIELLGTSLLDEIVVTNTFCGRPEGMLEVFVGVGTPLEYRVDDGPWQESNLFDGLSVGEHTVYIRDFFGCEESEEFEITTIGGLELSLFEIFFPECSDNNAAVTLQVETNSAEIVYWMEGLEPSPSPTFTSLAIGSYTFFAEDEFGCIDTLDVNITETSLIEHEAIVEDYICFLQDGSITIQSVGGLAPFNYSIDGGPFQRENSFEGLREGIYTIVISDREGCLSEIEAEVPYVCEPHVPNAITPDGNGINDRLSLLHERVLQVNEFRIFNSWGEVVYEKKNFTTDQYIEFWGGIDLTNTPGDQNVFLYEVIFIDIDQSQQTLKGVFHIVR